MPVLLHHHRVPLLSGVRRSADRRDKVLEVLAGAQLDFDGARAAQLGRLVSDSDEHRAAGRQLLLFVSCCQLVHHLPKSCVVTATQNNTPLSQPPGPSHVESTSKQ